MRKAVQLGWESRGGRDEKFKSGECRQWWRDFDGGEASMERTSLRSPCSPGPVFPANILNKHVSSVLDNRHPPEKLEMHLKGPMSSGRAAGTIQASVASFDAAKETIFCGAPLSNSVNSFAASPENGFPSRSVAATSRWIRPAGRAFTGITDTSGDTTACAGNCEVFQFFPASRYSKPLFLKLASPS
jgi:hypothetical protein